MPRHPRLFVPDLPLHIVQRGHNRDAVFVARPDFQYYLDNIVETKDRFDIRVHAYCLLTNHVHLLVTPGPDSTTVSSFMRVLAARQTRYVNRREGRSGTLWESRFKASLVETANYLLACYRYIELNPLRAAVAANPADYEWSSYRHNAGLERCAWLDDHPELVSLGSHPRLRQRAYASFVRDGTSDAECEFIRTALRRNQVTGCDRFRAELERRSGRRLSVAAPGRPGK